MVKQNLIGQKFHHLTVIASAPNNRRNRTCWECSCVCGKTKVVASDVLKDGRVKSCGCKTREWVQTNTGHLAPNWRGGVVYDDYGYKLIRLPEHHRAKSNGYVREHILVMEKVLGRALAPDENVHHLNGVKDDNRPENLELWCRSQPPGQRVVDLVSWAKEILKRYE